MECSIRSPVENAPRYVLSLCIEPFGRTHVRPSTVRVSPVSSTASLANGQVALRDNAIDFPIRAPPVCENATAYIGALNRHSYQRWYAGWPGFTATNVPRAVAQTFPPARSSASTTARSSAISTGRATSSIGPAVGVGRRSFTAYSAVTVHGGEIGRAHV